MIQVDFRPYTTAVRTSATHARPLALELRKTAPKGLGKELNAALATVEELADQVQIVLDERDKAAPTAIRPYIGPCQDSWMGLIGGLEARARLPREVAGSAKEAAELIAEYFPSGSDFTRFDARAFWSESQRRIDRMEREGDVRRIARLLGGEVFEAVRTTTARLGEALNLGESVREQAPPGDALRQIMGRFGRALGKYGRLMAARVDEEDDASVTEFLAAMAPIDEYRTTRNGGSGDETDEPATPAEPVVGGGGESPRNGGEPFMS